MADIFDDEVERQVFDEVEMIRCLLCNEKVERYWFDIHMAEECDGAGFESM